MSRTINERRKKRPYDDMWLGRRDWAYSVKRQERAAMKDLLRNGRLEQIPKSQAF